jgi:hypothetical protein
MEGQLFFVSLQWQNIKKVKRHLLQEDQAGKIRRVGLASVHEGSGFLQGNSGGPNHEKRRGWFGNNQFLELGKLSKST